MLPKRQNISASTNAGAQAIIDLHSLRQQDQPGRERDPEPLVREIAKVGAILGMESECIALVALDDQKGLAVCQQYNCEIIVVNGDRATARHALERRVNRQLKAAAPFTLLVATNSADLADLCEDAAQSGVNLSVFGSSANPPAQLLRFNYRPIETLVPEYRQDLIHVVIDYENIHYAERQRGRSATPEMIIKAIKAALEDQGTIVSIKAYADWSLMQRDSEIDIQRELARLDVDTRYLISIRGKNSADMRIADDLRTLLEHNGRLGGSVTKIAVCTNDVDFRPVVETAKARGLEVVLIGYSDGMSQQLRQIGNVVRYLDQQTVLAPAMRQSAPAGRTPDRDFVALAMRIEVWLGRQGWRWVFADRLVAKLTSERVGSDLLRRAVAAGVVLQSTRQIQHASGTQSNALTYSLNPSDPTVQAVRWMCNWLLNQLRFYLGERRMPYVDTALLARVMQMNQRCHDLGIGHDRDSAELWLRAAAAANLVICKRQPHPKTPEKIISTWWPNTEPAVASAQVQSTQVIEAPAEVSESDAPSETTADAAPKDSAPQESTRLPDSNTIRQLLTEALDDEQLRVLTYDNFRDVYERIGGGMTKGRVIQLLIEHAERSHQVPQLIQTAQRINPAITSRFLARVAA